MTRISLNQVLRLIIEMLSSSHPPRLESGNFLLIDEVVIIEFIKWGKVIFFVEMIGVVNVFLFLFVKWFLIKDEHASVLLELLCFVFPFALHNIYSVNRWYYCAELVQLFSLCPLHVMTCMATICHLLLI